MADDIPPVHDIIVTTAADALASLHPVPPIPPTAVTPAEPPKKPQGTLIWTHDMEEAMYREMVVQHRLAKRAGQGFKSEAWPHILAAIQAHVVTGHTVLQAQCQGKAQAHRKKWDVWRYLRYSLSGWGFDPVTQLLIADNAEWDKQIERTKITKQLRYKPLYFVEEFDELYLGRIATGEHVQAIHDAAIIVDPSLQDMPPPGTLPPDTPLPERSSVDDDNDEEDNEEHLPGTAKRRHERSALNAQTPAKRQKKTGGQYMGSAISSVGEQMNRSTIQREREVTQREKEEAQRIKETPQTAVETAMTLLLTTMDEEDSAFIIQAADVFLNEKKAHMYTTLGEGIRNEWLEKQVDTLN